jgi:hypothetical protein
MYLLLLTLCNHKGGVKMVYFDRYYKPFDIGHVSMELALKELGINCKKEVPQDIDLWACAFKLSEDKYVKKLFKKPVLGIVKGSYFFEYKKNSSDKKIRETSKVLSWSRVYADTYEEAVDFYNLMIKLIQKDLENIKQNIEKDKI